MKRLEQWQVATDMLAKLHLAKSDARDTYGLASKDYDIAAHNFFFAAKILLDTGVVEIDNVLRFLADETKDENLDYRWDEIRARKGN